MTEAHHSVLEERHYKMASVGEIRIRQACIECINACLTSELGQGTVSRIAHLASEITS
ncbi:hypothetical protein AL08_06630 [Corynebacterium diphtheriae bv. gravis str. ISS 4746]|nr:hypothetical protein AL07_06960 [Corynebacterium diphtheriae bv. gravis str. ISS 4060]KLN40431.1 hypothetical protein AL08_06630 [Corynebacterium diphtheriae bv. gravis str. ISS 4746]